MRYQVILKPLDKSPLTTLVIDDQGDGFSAVTIGVVDVQQVPNSNLALTALAALNNTVQPSAAQLAGLQGYLALIEAATATTTVESEIDDLLNP